MNEIICLASLGYELLWLFTGWFIGVGSMIVAQKVL